MKVLVVDDSAMTRIVAQKTLKGLGITDVLQAEDGQQGLELFQSEGADVVFSDWNMPNMDGLELLQAIRKENASVPVIMITTEGSKSKVLDAVQNGANDYLVKPFSPAALKEKLAKWVAAPVH